MAHDRTLCFKGSRQYLHSTTLFDDIVLLRGPDVAGIDFTFKHKTGRQVSYVPAGQFDPAAGAVEVASWRDGRGEIRVVERDAAIDCRTDYDEDALARSFAYEAERVTLPAQIGGHSVIEAIVAAFKALLQRTVAGPESKLAFVRIRLSAVPQLPLEVRFSRRIGEFYQGDIRVDGRAVGQIFFGEWR